MKVLEEFWYENINPMERPFQRQRKFDKVFRLLTKNEEELLKNLNEHEKELFNKVKACYDEMIQIIECKVPAKYGYTFKGWFTDPRTKQNQVTTFKFTKPDVLYAKWEPNPQEPVNQNNEIMAKDTCYLTD